MEQHPVPQNVTTFQFRLIGDMTLKQFGYLCAGAILAFIAYRLPLPFFFTWPLALGFAFLGIGFAFVPIEERPMDVWVFSFFKSIYSPTQYLWMKQDAPVMDTTRSASPQTVAPTVMPDVPPRAVPPAQHTPPPLTTHMDAPKTAPAKSAPTPLPTPVLPPTTVPHEKHTTTLTGLFRPPPEITSIPAPAQHHKPAAHVLTKKPSFWAKLFSWLAPQPKHPTQAPANPPATPKTLDPLPIQHPAPVTGYRPVIPQQAPVAAPPPPAENLVMQHKIKQLEDMLAALQKDLSTKSATEQRLIELQNQLTDVIRQKTQTENELTLLKRSALSKQPQQSPTPIPATVASPPATPQPTVKVITTQDAARKVGLPKLTNTPNVITGIIKDDAGNYLPGILITVTNTEGVPMRALKANKLGQFAASTPLTNGTYFIEIEDPRGRFTFDRAQITLQGSVVPALEILAKSQKQIVREKLAQEIFGQTPV